MFIGKSHELTRRTFLRRSAQVAGAGTASAYALGLAGLADAAAFTAGNDYKALVCVFLRGGNDHNNTLVPYDSTNHARYVSARGGEFSNGGIAISRSQLTATALGLPQGQVLTNDIQYALAPTMPKLKALYDSGAMAPLLNVGPLLAPTTRQQYDNRSVPIPPKLFSHNDQQSTWQSYGTEGATLGSGGRIGDLAMTSNTNSIFTCISATSDPLFLAGDRALTYRVSSTGAVPIDAVVGGRLYRSEAASAALRSLLTQPSAHYLEADLTTITKRSIETQAFVNTALSGVNLATSFAPASGTNRLAEQLEIVARLIAARQALGVKRQVFMVSMGGFDNHDDLASTHLGLLSQLDFAMDAFYRATAELGIADSVTSFTASDFGRTLTSNGDGSDHGWGAHHFIMGGAVAGGRFYGTAPAVSVDTPDQVGRGRLLPAVSVDQYMATLGKWFGVADSELRLIAPNLGRFATPDLGFMRAPVTSGLKLTA